MLKTNFTKIHLKKKVRKFRRGISPIVAEMLLIGLTMLAGAITFGTVIVILNTKEPIVVSVDSFSDFKLVNSSSSTKYNSFSFVLDNQGKRDAGVKASDFRLYNVTGGSNTLLLNWTMSRDYDLSSLQSYYVTITSNSSSVKDWLSFGSTIKVQLVAYGLDQSYSTADKATVTSSITIGSNLVSSGPLRILTNQSQSGSSNYAVLDSTNSNNNTLEIVVQNYGHLDVNYTLDFMVSNRNVSITNTYVNSLGVNLSSTIGGSLPAAIGNNPSSSANLNGTNETIIFSVTSTKSVSTDLYYVIVWLKIESTVQDTLVIVC